MTRKPASDMETIEAQIDALRSAVREAVARAVGKQRNGVMTLAELILNERRRLSMSLQDVASAAGMTKSHVWELEDGRTKNPTVKAVYGISVALGVPFAVACECALRSVSP